MTLLPVPSVTANLRWRNNDMGKRYNHYHIKISFDKRRRECNVGLMYANYLNSRNHKDTFVFLQNELTIVASRTTKFTDGAILCSNQNSIYNQILKGLLYYYSLANDFPQIKSVEIVRKRARLGDYVYDECSSNIIQPVVNVVAKPFTFDNNQIKVLFDETEKGNAIRIALSYWLKGVSSSERYYKFEHLWKAYNRLFMYQGNSPKEVDGMSQMRLCILRNESFFANSQTVINVYTSEALRSLRWRNLIFNDYDAQKKTRAFKDFILRYTDNRIMSLFSAILPYRSDYLRRESLYDQVETHIEDNLHTICDMELVTLLSLKYAYFVRNKMFHGEIPDSTFKLHETNEDIEIDRMNELLTPLVFEIINNNNILR